MYKLNISRKEKKVLNPISYILVFFSINVQRQYFKKRKVFILKKINISCIKNLIKESVIFEFKEKTLLVSI